MSLYVQHTSASMNESNESIEMLDDGVISGMSDDDDDDCMSSVESAYNENDMMQGALDDEVAAQLAAAGPVGVAAAAAIASAKKRKRPHSFETNPSIRKRQQNRLLRKLRQTIYEFATRVGQQAVVLVATPGKPHTTYKVFGAKPLEDVVKNLKSIVMEELESALAQQAPPPVLDDPTLFELPPLIIDGIPTPVEKMTQAQLRAFIPLMLKYSTGRGKPGWGRESTRPSWWPKELPWANVRMDARPDDDKHKDPQISWTHALRKIVVNCYKYHGREDLLPAFNEEDEKANQVATSNSSVPSANYTQTMIHSIQNADGTVSIIQVDPNNQIITLPDGTTAQVQGVATLHTTDGGNNHIHTVQSVDNANHGNTGELTTVDLTEATLGQDGQLIITGEDGHGYPVSVSGMITLPVNSSVYQTMVANIQQLQSNQDGTLCITPMQVHKSSSGGGGNSHHSHHAHHATSTLISSSTCSSGNCGSSATTTTSTCTSTMPSASANPSYPLYNPYTAHQHHAIFGQSAAAIAAAAQLRSAAAMNLVAGRSAAAAAAAAAASAHLSNVAQQQLKLKRTTLMRSQEHHNHNNNNNNNTMMANFNHNAVSSVPVKVPKVELADEDHSQAVIDADGNIIIRFGNGAPIKIECDSTDFKAND